MGATVTGPSAPLLIPTVGPPQRKNCGGPTRRGTVESAAPLEDTAPAPTDRGVVFVAYNTNTRATTKRWPTDDGTRESSPPGALESFSHENCPRVVVFSRPVVVVVDVHTRVPCAREVYYGCILNNTNRIFLSSPQPKKTRETGTRREVRRPGVFPRCPSGRHYGRPRRDCPGFEGSHVGETEREVVIVFETSCVCEDRESVAGRAITGTVRHS